MNQRIGRLEQLLERVRRNRDAPRARQTAGPGTATSRDDEQILPPAGHAVAPARPPASSRRPKRIPDLELAEGPSEPLPPVMTPPLESGAHAASAQRLSPALPPFDEIEPGSLRSAPPSADLVRELQRGQGPTVEQLGNTLELDDAQGPPLELAAPIEEHPASERDELEEPLPRGLTAGTYDDSLLPPPSVHEDLRRHKELVERYSLVPEEPPPPEPAAGIGGVPGIFSRSEVSSSQVAHMVKAAQRFQPKTFIEWLDASLDLGKH